MARLQTHVHSDGALVVVPASAAAERRDQVPLLWVPGRLRRWDDAFRCNVRSQSICALESEYICFRVYLLQSISASEYMAWFFQYQDWLSVAGSDQAQRSNGGARCQVPLTGLRASGRRWI